MLTVYILQHLVLHVLNTYNEENRTNKIMEYRFSVIWYMLCRLRIFANILLILHLKYIMRPFVHNIYFKSLIILVYSVKLVNLNHSDISLKNILIYEIV